MKITTKSIDALPEAQSVTTEDLLPVYKDGKAHKAAAALFKGEKGDDATINGVNTLTIHAGDNITLTQEDDELSISAHDTVYDPATPSSDGLMSAADKGKLDGIASGAEVNVLEGVSVNGTAVPVTNKTANLTLNKTTVGLGNVDNTADTDKPVSTAQQAALDNKVDKVAGKGLSTNDYTTAEKDKLLGIEEGAQVNEVTLENYRKLMGAVYTNRVLNSVYQKQMLDFRSAFYSFLSKSEGHPYKSASGTGFIVIHDADDGVIQAITVDISLNGQRLYVQVNNSNGLTQTAVTVNSKGVASVSLATVRGVNTVAVSTTDYVFPSSGSATGTFVNSHTDENGQWAYDYWIPTNGVEATVHYCQDVERADEETRVVSEDDLLAMFGLRVTYSRTTSPATVQEAGKQLYYKVEGYPFATKDKPKYAQCTYPDAKVKVYYVAEYDYLWT